MQLRDNMLKIFNDYEKTKRDAIDEMMKKPKSYNGPALEFNDPEQSEQIRKKENKLKKMLKWNGDEDVENVSNMFLDVLWDSCKTTAALVKEKKWADQKKAVAEKEAREAALRAE